MMPLPWPRILGWPYRAGGEVLGPEPIPDSDPAYAGAMRLAVSTLSPNGDDDSIALAVFRNGQIEAIERVRNGEIIATTSSILSAYEVIDLLPVFAGVKRDVFDDCDLFYCVRAGNRVRLRWPLDAQPPESDFLEYIIYWSGGDAPAFDPGKITFLNFKAAPCTVTFNIVKNEDDVLCWDGPNNVTPIVIGGDFQTGYNDETGEWDYDGTLLPSAFSGTWSVGDSVTIEYAADGSIISCVVASPTSGLAKLTSIPRKQQSEFTTQPLATGTYRFGLGYKDRFGNERKPDERKVATVTTKAAPDPPVISNIAFDAEARALTADFDAAPVLVFSNWLHGMNTERGLIAWQRPFDIASAEAWQSPPLWAGRWKLAFVRRVNGIDSIPVFYSFTLVRLDDGSLAQLPAMTNPRGLIATARASAEIVVTWFGGSPLVEVEYSDDDGETWQSFGEFETPEPLTIAGTNGVTYLIRARSKAVSEDETTLAVGEWETVSVTADGAAPTGSQTLTAEAMF